MKRFIVAALLAIGLVGSANAQPTAVDPDKYPNLANPIVMAQPGKLPDIAECRDVINQTVIDLVNESDVDPGEVYESNRRAHPNMIMEPPPVECASKLWNAIRADGLSLSGKRVVVPAGTEALSLRQYPVDSLFDLHASSASIGTNVDPANGVEGYQGETAISIDPNNPQHMVAFSNTFYKDPAPACQSPTGGTANTYGTMALFGSTDGGSTWTYNCAPWPAGATGGVTGAAFWFGSDPALAWDSSGRAYACYMLISQNSAGTASGASIVVARSADNGLSWQNLGIVVNNITSSTAGDDKEMMAIDNTSGQPFSHPGRIYVIWDAANKEKIAYSDDGSTWTTVNFASNTGAIGGNVVVGADGTVYVIWNRYNVETIVFSKSTDGGATWTAPAVISTMALQSFGTNNTPPAQNSRGVNAFGSIDIDRNPSSPYFNTLYVSFPDFPTGTTTGADINTYVIRSTNGGTSWSSRVKVNDDNFGATQFFPWLSVDQSDGSVNVSWYDTRLDPLNRKTQMVYARSVDGGVSFEPNLLVTDGGSAWRNNVNFADENSVDNPTFNGNQYGDYSGIAALNRQVHPLWTDSRSFFPSADTVSPTRREDNGTSTIVNCSAPNALIAPLVNPTSAPSVVVSWSAPSSWGTNATGGTYSVYRNTTSTFPGGSPLVSGLTATSYADVTGVAATTYFYFVRAKNNCPGTALTPMSTDSPASPAVVYGTAGNAVGTLQGTVTSAGIPVSGATVTAGTLTATTNASGFYQFAAIDAGTYTVGASATGYSSASVSGVTVADGLTTIQNLSLSALATSSSCFTDTTYNDFGAGTGTNVELSTSVGDVKLVVASGGPNVPDRHADDNGFGSGYGFSSTALIGQTFTPNVTANVTKVDASLWCSACSGTNPNITMELRTTASSLPVMTAAGLLGSSTVTGTSSGVPAPFSFTFNVPLTAGTQYAVVVRLVSNRTTGTQAWSASSGDVMTGGRRVTCTTSTCSNPTGTNANSDLLFIEYNTTPTVYATSGSLVSVVRDSGAVAGSSANWSTLSWTATTPANTSVQFQAAGSNSASGPFTFVGPDGTAASFFTTSGASLSQFNGKRYLRTKAILSTTDTTTTPTLSDVTVCTSVVSCDGEVPTVTPAPAQVCAGSTGNTASGPAGMSTYAWSITNGTITSAVNGQAVTYTAGTAGSAVLSLTVTSASGCQTVGTATVPVNAIPAPPTITPSGSAAFCIGSNVTLTSSSATGNQWYLNGNPIGGATSQTYAAATAGNYTVTVTNSGCTSAASAATNVTANTPPAAPTIAISNSQSLTVGGGSGSFTLTFNGQTTPSIAFNATAGTIQSQLNALSSVGGVGGTTTVSGSAGAFTVTFGGTLTGPQPQLVATPAGGATAVVNAAAICALSAGNQASGPAGAATYAWSITNGTITSANNIQTITYTAGASGTVTLSLTVTNAATCSASSSATQPTNPVPATPTINAGGPTTFCAGGSVTLTSSSASGNQWYLNGSPIGGATNQTFVATASGDYTVVVSASGCSSAASSATTVTVGALPSTPTITPSGPTTFCAGGSVPLTSSSASGNQWYLNGNPISGETNQTYVATASGNYTVVVTSGGCASAPSSATTVTVNPAPATPTITPGGPTTFCAGGSVTLTSSSPSGNQWYVDGNPIGGATNQAFVATATGNYTVTVTASGCPSAPSSATAVTVNPIPSTPTITPGGPTTFCAGNSVTLTSSSATGNQWYLNGSPIGGATNQAYVATATGNYTVVVTTSGCSSAASSVTSVTVNPAPATPTITPGGPTTFCAGGSVTLTSSSASGNQWYLDGSPIGGATNQAYVATATGNYTVTVTASGCPSAPSSATAVTVNPIPSTPTVTPGGPTTFCAGNSVTLTSSSATGNQWYLNGSPIGGATNQAYVATATGNYTVVVTTSGCSSAASSATSVTVNPAPSTPTITPGGPTTFCAGGSVTLTSSSASGNQWYLNGSPIGGATNQAYVATATGNYTVVVTTSGCPSAPSSATAVTVNPIPSTPTITPGGPTTFCAGGSVTLTSSSASGNQWFLNGNPIGGATNQAYVATATGNYTVAVTTSGCSSAASSATAVTVNPIPSTPTITPSGPTTFCAGGSVTLTSSSASGNQWLLNGSPIGGATSQQYVVTSAGDYSVTVTTSGCASAASAVQTVTVNPVPNATITAPGSVAANSTGNTASVASAGGGATYNWSITGGTITAGSGTPNITFTAGAAGTLTLQVTVTAGGCSDTKSASVNVTALSSVSITSVVPPSGKTTGGRDVTINGTGFLSGATVTFGGSAATNVVVVNSTKITAKTPAHAAGAVNVTVTNTDTSTATRTNGYTYVTMQFDANGDGVVDPADIFYLVNYLFLSGPQPAGPSGMLSGDANGDSLVDPADIFYVVNYLFMNGPTPNAVAPTVSAQSVTAPLSGAVTLGQPFLRGDRYVVPVSVSSAGGAEPPRALSLRVTFSGEVGNATIRRAGALSNAQPSFEISRNSGDAVAYLLVLDPNGGLAFRNGDRSMVVAELELDAKIGGGVTIDVDPALTMLGDATGTHTAKVSARTLRVSGTTIDRRGQPQMKDRE